ncbi:unnamed protein product [Adineta steineri]|uniref:NAD(+)--protein-arginine ADP-ribosyltransferase n=1 Tax=Adineta steineri TaxID=433720 RepID=A0A815TEB3_9BILA|nr:unnamed protein product [Adineta steineri]
MTVLCDHFVTGAPQAEWVAAGIDGLFNNGTHKKPTLNWALSYVSTIQNACISPKSSFKYYFGKTYRGINVTEQDLLVYHVNSFIIQKTFASTSKDRSFAEGFVSSSGPGQIPAICTYVLDNPDMKFFIDMEDISAIPDEKEVLILPFSMFMISKIDRTKNNNFIEIELTVPTTTRIESLDLNDWEPSDNVLNWAINLIDIPTLMAGIDIDDMTSD